jgi:hypothetical protein
MLEVPPPPAIYKGHCHDIGLSFWCCLFGHCKSTGALFIALIATIAAIMDLASLPDDILLYLMQFLETAECMSLALSGAAPRFGILYENVIFQRRRVIKI